MRQSVCVVVSLLLVGQHCFPQSTELHAGQDPPSLSYVPFGTTTAVSLDKKEMGNTVYLIDFWATWCAPCIESIPHIDSLIDEFKGKNVKFISITYEPSSRVGPFLLDHPLHSHIGIDTSFSTFRTYNAWAIPNIVMINSKGIIAGRIHPSKLNEHVINDLLEGTIPDVPNTPENLFKPDDAEAYFRSLLEKGK